MRHAYPEFVWFNGSIRPWAEATVHVMAHVVHYGSSVFEGIRIYPTPRGPAIFRLDDHLRRLYLSAKVYDMPLPYDQGTLAEACRAVVRANGSSTDYLRPVAWRGLGGFGLSADTPIEVAVVTWKMGQYLGQNVVEEGIDACVTSWNRVAPNTIPAGAKAGGNYLSGQLIAREARRLGFGEGIALAKDGLISEGAGENLFLLIDGVLYTPPVAAGILNGITRDTVIRLAAEEGIEVREQNLPREYLYFADEVFMCGTAVEITPLRSIDGRPVGAGVAGAVTRRLQQRFFDLVHGRAEDARGWLTAVD
jgi:branched-chain amino acid aminotransferase